MSKATELADKFEDCPLNYLGEVAPMLRAQDEAIKLALEALTKHAGAYRGHEHKIDEAITKLREVQG